MLTSWFFFFLWNYCTMVGPVKSRNHYLLQMLFPYSVECGWKHTKWRNLENVVFHTNILSWKLKFKTCVLCSASWILLKILLYSPWTNSLSYTFFKPSSFSSPNPHTFRRLFHQQDSLCPHFLSSKLLHEPYFESKTSFHNPFSSIHNLHFQLAKSFAMKKI